MKYIAFTNYSSMRKKSIQSYFECHSGFIQTTYLFLLLGVSLWAEIAQHSFWSWKVLLAYFFLNSSTSFCSGWLGVRSGEKHCTFLTAGSLRSLEFPVQAGVSCSKAPRCFCTSGSPSPELCWHLGAAWVKQRVQAQEQQLHCANTAIWQAGVQSKNWLD